ncbi:MAG: hypothetical protein JO326_07040, partial [Acetobacteraceae bacterium]|nr:hypothetical protein [Acetobacteraceae bacterium]
RGTGNGTERRLAAILGADVHGYSALMSDAEEATHARVGAVMDRVRREIERHHGRVFSFAGDGLMAEFPSAVDALRCALRIQADIARRADAAPTGEARIAFRMGLNAGEIIVQRGRTGGHAVNIASRLEQIADPGGICLSAAAYDQVRRVVTARFEPGGERRLKNIREPVAVYRLPPHACREWAGLPRPSRDAQEVARSSPPEYRASLAVLPFRTLQPDQSDAYFAEGMVDDIIRALGGLRDLLVIARSSSQTFAGAPLDLRRIAHELDVRYVVHGSVRRVGDALRIAAELAEVPGGQVIWADRFDGKLDDLFNLQDKIALATAAAVAPQLRERELSRALRKRPDDMTAYDLTLQALHSVHRLERDALREAQGLLEQATAIDPAYAPAHSQLALLRFILIGQLWSEDEAGDRAAAELSAKAAVEHDPNDALGLAVCGHLQSYVLGNYHAARTLLDRAIAAGPSNAWAWGYSGLTHSYLGNIQDAIAHGQRAVRLSPIGNDAFWFEHFLSQSYFVAERYADAVAWSRSAMGRNDRDVQNLRCLAASLAAYGETDEARRIARRLLELTPGYTVTRFAQKTHLRPDACARFVAYLREAGIPD